MKIGNSGITIRRWAAACVLLAGGVMLTCCDRANNSSPSAAAGAKRVVSFSPAITQMMFDMGLGDQVVGVTRFCKLPAGIQRPRVGDARSFNSEAILAVRPDVVFAQTAPAKFQGVRDIDGHIKIISLGIESLDDIPAAMLAIGKELRCGKIARDKADAFGQAIEAGDAEAARKAATSHMDNAIARIEKADPAFWQQTGDELASALVHGLPASS